MLSQPMATPLRVVPPAPGHGVVSLSNVASVRFHPQFPGRGHVDFLQTVNSQWPRAELDFFRELTVRVLSLSAIFLMQGNTHVFISKERRRGTVSDVQGLRLSTWSWCVGCLDPTRRAGCLTSGRFRKPPTPHHDPVSLRHLNRAQWDTETTSQAYRSCASFLYPEHPRFTGKGQSPQRPTPSPSAIRFTKAKKAVMAVI